MEGWMALDSYSGLQASIASWLHRDDLTTEIPDFIRLAEADLQVRANLSQWDTETTVPLTSGIGALPADFSQAISVKYGSDSYTITYRPTEQFDDLFERNGSGSPEYFTIRGSNLVVTPTATGDALLRYTARFTALSDSATTNSLLALFPDAYLQGALMHANAWLQDDAQVNKYAALFEASINRIRKYMNAYKYPYGLQMRVA